MSATLLEDAAAPFVLASLIEAAFRTPRAPVLVGTSDRLDYATLADAVRRVAHAVARATPPSAAVATLLPHAPWGIAGALGVHASGRPAIILSTNDPPERNAAILADARPALLVTDGAAPPSVAVPTLALHDALAKHAPGAWAPEEAAPHLLVHFTSGSTGAPRGIVTDSRYLRHRSALFAGTMGMTEADTLLAVSTIATNSGFSQVISAIRTGGRTLVCDLARDGAGPLLRLATAERASVGTMFTLVMRMLSRLPAAPAAFADVTRLRLGGMPLPSADLPGIRAVLRPDCALTHTYASTEANEIASWRVPPDYICDEPTLPVGRRAPVHEIALIDESGAPAADGAAGEVVVTSPVIACGEWEGGRLVPGRMPEVPGRPGWRRFRTGDVLRLGPDGMLRFVARTDRQIKVNGLRIEPGEIEAVLRRHPDVTDALVLPATAGDDVPLAAFVTAATDAQDGLHDALRTHVATLLPRTMRPARIAILDEFPLLRNGKIDVPRLRALSRAPKGEA